jgi:N-acetylglucosaminyl-diphospho-decaprenol L-rhamnosyltransferase
MVSALSRVAVVVVTFNSAALLQELITSLGPGMRGTDWCLVVADNASSDDTVNVIRRLAPKALLVETGHNGGYSAGINAAVAAASDHDAILVLNPDVRLMPDSATKLLHTLGSTDAGIVVPRLMNGQGALLLSMRREPTLLRAFAGALLGVQRAGRLPRLGEIVSRPGLYTEAQVTDWAEGSTQLISAECWRAVGPWDESFFLFSEEADFDLRARDAGFTTRYVPEASAVHLTGGSSESPGLWRLLVLNQVRLFHKRNGLARTIPFWMATTLRELSRTIQGRPTSKAALGALCSPARWRQKPGPDAVS